VAEPGHGDRVRCVRVVVAPEPLWFGSVSTCVFHVSGCGWSCVLESWPLYARSRYENSDSGAMPVTKKMTAEGVLGVPWVARWEASGAGRVGAARARRSAVPSSYVDAADQRPLRAPTSFLAMRPTPVLPFSFSSFSSGVVHVGCHQGGGEQDGKGWGSAWGEALYSVLAHGKANGAMAIEWHGGSRCHLGWC
jgi:hypothetical protein